MGKLRSNSSGTHYTTDYLIIGMGLAGCVLASLLSKDPKYSVIGIEAGQNDTQLEPIKNPIFVGVEYGLTVDYYPEFFWQCRPMNNGTLSNPDFSGGSDPIHCSCIPRNQKLTTVGDYTTGRTLGGGSSINGLQYVRGTPPLYQIWSQFGPQWSFENVLHTYVCLENYLGTTPNPAVHGYNGPMSIRQAPVVPTSMAEKFALAISQGTGVPQIPDSDYNNPATPIGSFTKWELFQNPDKTRASSATDFLGPTVMTPDGQGTEGKGTEGQGTEGRQLLVLYKTTSNKIIWKGNRAVGLEAIQNGKSIKICARKKVIVCQGIYSAALLQRSGVGPAELLECLGIPLVVPNSNVGKNWTNQTLVPFVFTANPNDLPLPPDDPQALYTGGAFLPPVIPQDNPNLRGYQVIGAGATGSLFGFFIHLQPKSLGTLRIQSKDPTDIPLADNNYFGDPADMQAYIQGFQTYLSEIAASLAAIDPQYQLVAPDPATLSDPVALEGYIIDNFNHTHHWMGSNRMGCSPATGVVDGWGNVFGAENLMVVDNSISPHINDGNTGAPIFVLATVIGWHLLCERKKCKK